jgi:hypothetical protein
MLENKPHNVFLILCEDFDKYKLQIPKNFTGSEIFIVAKRGLARKKVSLKCLKLYNEPWLYNEEGYEVIDMKGL